MKQFSIPIIVVLAIVAAVAVNGWRGAGGRFNATSAELITTSNKVAEVTAKLAEQGAATETLRVQLNLEKSDLAAASNHIGALSGQLKQATARTHELEAELQKRLNEIAALNQNNAQLATRIKDLEAQTAARQSTLENARDQVAETAKRLEAANTALNESESAKAALLAKLNDPSVLRAQLKAVSAPVSGSAPKGKEPVVLYPDGSVSLASPVFSEPPPGSRPSL